MAQPSITYEPGDPTTTVLDGIVRAHFETFLVGQQTTRGGPGSTQYTIVGVVGTINAIDLGQPLTKERLYYPVGQQPAPSIALVLKTALDPTTIVPQSLAAVESIDPEQPISDVRTILALVLGQGMRTAGIGVAIGLVASLALARYLQSLLFGVTTHDATVFASVTVVLLAVAAAARYLPAHRATRIDPMEALRES